MLVYIYDGTFEGIMCSIFDAFSRKEKPGAILRAEGLQISVLDTYRRVETDIEKSNRVFNSIEKNISIKAVENIYHAGLSDFENVGKLILDYYQIGLKMRSKIDYAFAIDTVCEIEQIVQNVKFECHKYLGFLRFEKLKDDILYAPFEPKNHILPLVLEHFSDRMKNDRWMIHDVRRNLAGLYNGQSYVIAPFDMNVSSFRDEGEEEIKKLWKTFFNTIAIESRKNRKLQIQNMPKRYHKYLPEKN